MVKAGSAVANEDGIEQGIEIPTRRINEEMWQIAEKMESGDSKLYDKAKEARSLRNKLHKLKKKSVLREVDGGFRVWCK